MSIEDFLSRLAKSPKEILFENTMETIEKQYDFQPTAFENGVLRNEVGQNSGSCKLFAFAQLQNLSEQETLDCFGQYYREDVLKAPDGDNHQNIRNFMKHGWSGIKFEGEALKQK